jgi:predicted aconitase with swiveling domain
MKKLILNGRMIHGGVAEGEALVTKKALGGMGVFNVDTGTVIELGHDWKDQSVAGKVLVFKSARGSSSWSMWHQILRFLGTGPAAYVVTGCNPQVALGAVTARVPAVTELDQDPTEVIETGDWVKVDGDKGIIEVTKSEQ